MVYIFKPLERNYIQIGISVSYIICLFHYQRMFLSLNIIWNRFQAPVSYISTSEALDKDDDPTLESIIYLAPILSDGA